MKKTSKALSGIALSAALALGCAAPAFAAPDNADGPYGTEVGTQQQYVKKQNETTATDVKIATVVTNINVAVPLTITIVADAAGTDILAPTAGLKTYDGATGALPTDGSGITGYRIENYSTYPIAIKGIEVTDNSDGDWALVEAIAADNLTKTGEYGDLALTLTPSAAKAVNAVPTVNEGDKSGGNNAVTLFDALDAKQEPGWIVDRQVSDTEPAIMGLLLAGKNSALKNVNDDSVLLGSADDPKDPDPLKPDEAFKIIYTVGAASTAQGN